MFYYNFGFIFHNSLYFQPSVPSALIKLYFLSDVFHELVFHILSNKTDDQVDPICNKLYFPLILL